ncbi:hypothetical protein BU16DRAFT_612731 [Lophium mytilinum]|uniref:DUF1275 domain protein n=1 Tax=Lophium mytilinum TaxID=390894 RepID=A0A6A6REB3_9PEZI|nr:hypothetical protein BU16DRAFT_612731 [Lophium mytilinum]
MLSFIVQSGLLILAAALATAGLVPEDPNGRGINASNIKILTALPPLAFQFGIQIATSRILGFNELPTNVLTSAYADVAGDPKLFSLAWNAKRDRRIGSIVLILGGGICGAWMMRKGVDLYVPLWIAAGLKLLLAVGVWVCMSAKSPSVSKDRPIGISKTAIV